MNQCDNGMIFNYRTNFEPSLRSITLRMKANINFLVSAPSPLIALVVTEYFPNSISNKGDLTYSHGGSVRNSNRRRTPGQGGGGGSFAGKLAVKFAFLFDLFKEMPSQS